MTTLSSLSSSTPPRTTVLVVEDEPLLRLYAVDLIEEAGFDVADARDAEQAIAILASRSDIGILFTDVDMPGPMDGLELAAAVRDRWPSIEIVLTSGQVTPPAEALPARSPFFPKPLDERRLIGTLRGFVDGASNRFA